jgi:AcrR family transcriptional regulator
MTTDYSGGGDPQRTIELLWGTWERPRRGPKPRLTLDAIVRAAVDLADAEGLGAVSMRRLADEVGTTAMSLYTYLPGKAELIDLMVDRVCADATRPADGPTGWRAKLERVAHDNWALYHRHPWLLQMITSRPPLGPGVTGKYDAELRAVDAIGLTDVEMDAVLSLVLGHVEGAARRSVEAAQVVRGTGQTDEQWWAAASPVLDQVFDAHRYPLAARVGLAAGEQYGAASDPEHAFEFGLRRILDGVEVLVRSRASPP